MWRTAEKYDFPFEELRNTDQPAIEEDDNGDENNDADAKDD